MEKQQRSGKTAGDKRCQGGQSRFLLDPQRGLPFTVLVDPRIERCKRHELGDILTIAVCAVLSGAEGWVGVEQWALGKRKWLRQFLQLPNGIPSHDTLSRVFARLDPGQLSYCLLQWTAGLATELSKAAGVVAIDGKTLRRSFDRAAEQSPLHLLTAWASEARLVLAQHNASRKGNEITAIPQLLSKLDVCGCTVTLDAMGCQKSVAQELTERGADYVMTLKKNHSSVYQDVEGRFAYAERQGFETTLSGERFIHDTHKSVDGEHGRIELRTVTALQACQWFHRQHPGWDSVHSVVRVQATRQTEAKTTEQTRYFLSSLPANHAEMVANAIRAHWAIENDLHWTLDVQMNEDACRIRKDHGAENFATLRRFALGRLKQDTSLKVGVKTKQLRAASDDAYRLKLLHF